MLVIGANVVFLADHSWHIRGLCKMTALWVVFGAQHCAVKCSLCSDWTEAGGPQLFLTSSQHCESYLSLSLSLLICAVNSVLQGENENDITLSTMRSGTFF